MWMCDNCEAINNDEDVDCPKCRRSRGQTGPAASGYRPTASPAPTFSTALDSSGSQGTSPIASGTSQSGNYAGPPPANYQASRGNSGMGVGGVMVLIAAILVRMLSPGRLFLLAGGIACIWGGNYIGHQSDAFKAQAIKTTGTVERLDKRGGGDSPSYYPVAYFHTASGASVEVSGSIGSNPPANHVGDIVTVYYNPKSPTDAMIDSSIGNFIPIGLIVVGSLIVLAAVFSSAKPNS